MDPDWGSPGWRAAPTDVWGVLDVPQDFGRGKGALANSVTALCSTGRVRKAEREHSSHVMGLVSHKSLLRLANLFSH